MREVSVSRVLQRVRAQPDASSRVRWWRGRRRRRRTRRRWRRWRTRRRRRVRWTRTGDGESFLNGESVAVRRALEVSGLSGGGGQLAPSKVLHVTARTIPDDLSAVMRRIARRRLRLLYVVVTVPHDPDYVCFARDVGAVVECDRDVGEGRRRRSRRRIGRRKRRGCRRSRRSRNGRTPRRRDVTGRRRVTRDSGGRRRRHAFREYVVHPEKKSLENLVSVHREPRDDERTSRRHI